jgi:hypothetical protein
MPPLATITISLLERLSRDRRYAPADVVRADLDRVQSLVWDLESERGYPEDFVEFRLTGRGNTTPRGEMIVGEALVAELSAYAERLSEQAGLAPPEGAVDSAELCERWSISRKTLDRFRRRGLIAWRVRGPDGRARLVFPAGAVEEFERRRREMVDRAGRFSRIEPELEAQIVRRAERYHRALGCSLNQAALRLAERFGRSHEAIRKLLQRHERIEPVFKQVAVLGERERRVMFRAWRLGAEPTALGRRYRKSRGSVLRAISLERADRLRALRQDGALEGPEGPTFAMPDAEGVLLSAEPVRRGLGVPGQTDLLSFVLGARRRVVPMGAVEQARAVAYQFLRWRASSLINDLHVYNPASGDVDGIETLLRWAARLKAELVRQELALALETLEKSTGKPLDELDPGHAGVLARELLEKVGEAVDHFDPFKAARAGGRLAGPVALAVQKLAVRVVRDRQAQPAPRPSGRLSAKVAFEDWTLAVSPWQTWLEPDRRVRRFAGAGGPEAAGVLAARFGWADAAPRTIEQAAADMSISTIAVVKLERRGIQAALAASREATPATHPAAAN